MKASEEDTQASSSPQGTPHTAPPPSVGADLLEVCRAAGAGAAIDYARIPFLPRALHFAAEGYVTGASGRNLEGYGDDVLITEGLPTATRAVLADPQTSGGLLVACDAAQTHLVLEIFHREGFSDATVIGEMVAGPPRVVVR